MNYQDVCTIDCSCSFKKISGNLNQPKWGHLKQLHAAIKSGEKVLTNSSSSTKRIGNGTDVGDRIELNLVSLIFLYPK